MGDGQRQRQVGWVLYDSPDGYSRRLLCVWGGGVSQWRAPSIPLTGDWDTDVNKTITVGVYRTDINPERFELRNSNSAGPPQIILNAGTQPTGYQPVAGKWAGSNSVTKVGVLALDGAWYLDNGNFVVDGCPPDTCFNTSAWTQPGDKPLAGDWDGNGIVTIGVFRPSTGKFYLSNQMPPTGVDVTISAGSYRPVVGNWTGLGGTKLGVYNQGTGGWYLVNGLVPTTCATDFCYPAGSLGIAEDLPVSFGLSVIRAN
ncbi:MAG TPA: hypothetical protein VGX03_04560 [Candidatus Binatia bacterium]|nr:hypothetical protein [Candidatus Binatia bacterium]